MNTVMTVFFLVPFAFLSSLLMGTAFGFLGSFLVLKKQGFLADTVAHASLLGVAIGYFMGIAPQSILIPFSVFLSVGLTWMSLRPEQDTVAVSAVLFSACAGFGALLLGMKGLAGQEIVHVMLGDVLWVTEQDFALFFVSSVFVVAFVFANRKKLTLLMLNRDLAIATGIRPGIYEYGFSACVALLIAVSIKLVGVFLVTSLVAIPPLIASQFAHSFRQQLLISTLVGVGLTGIGFFLALTFDLPFGPAISTLLGGTAFVCHFLTREH